MMKNIENKDPMLYLHDGNYAHNNAELDMYRKSNEANIACNELIAKALNDHFDGLHLDAAAVMEELLKEYRVERIQYVLANTIQHKDWDGRFSRENKTWAKSIEVVPLPDPWGTDRTCYFVVDKAHSCLVDGLVTYFRKEIIGRESGGNVMFFPPKEVVERLREEYPIGCRVMLDKMDDVQAPPIGTCGTCMGVDDTGSIMVRWDNGSVLNVVYGEDRCPRLD